MKIFAKVHETLTVQTNTGHAAGNVKMWLKVIISPNLSANMQKIHSKPVLKLLSLMTAGLHV